MYGHVLIRCVTVYFMGMAEMGKGVVGGSCIKLSLPPPNGESDVFTVVYFCLSLCLLATSQMSPAPCLIWRPLSTTWVTCCAPVPFPPDVAWPGGKSSPSHQTPVT